MTPDMIRALHLSFFLALTTALAAQSPPAHNMVLLGNWDDPDLPRYSDVWGYARDGREYALIGSQDFVHIIDVTNPGQPTEIAALNAFANSGSVWRDIKVLGDYAYCVTETAEGLQVIDLGDLPDSAAIVYQTDEAFDRCHNIFIDETSAPPRLYAFGSRPGIALDGYVVYGLADPALPQLIAEVEITSTDDPSLGYIHDGFARNDTLYANHGGNGFYVYDVADPANPVEIGSLTNYVESGYNHSVWATDNGRTMVMCDETQDRGVKVLHVDKSDPFGLDIRVASVFRSKLLAPDTASLAHNPYVLGDSLVVLSYYGDGIQVWDITDPAAPFRRGYYDTTPDGGSYGGGVWGAYPWLPSGNILGSDVNNGLFIVALQDMSTLPVEYAGWSVAAEGKDAALAWTTATEDANAGWAVEHAVAGGSFAPVGWVPAGTGRYGFTHVAPGPGLHFYRLRQVDHDGTETLSDLRSVTFTGGAGASLAPRPNPAPAAAPVSLSGGFTEWQLLTMNGKTLRTGAGTVPTVGLAKGTYLLRSGSRTAKLVVQ